MKIERIYLDMDGVLSNFVAGAARLFGMSESELVWEPGKGSSVHVPLGLSEEEELWSVVDAEGVAFWETMPLFPWTNQLWKTCTGIAPTFIATSPSRNAVSAFGKVRWLQRWLGTGFRDYVITPRKEHLAKPGRVLIDDWEKKCIQFGVNGGDAILFPRPYNNNRHEEGKIAFVLSKLHELEDRDE